MVIGDITSQMPVKQVINDEHCNTTTVVISCEYDLEQRLIATQRNRDQWKAKYEAAIEVIKLMRGDKE